jgi:hypothetical protein
MEYTIEMASGGIMYAPTSMAIDSGFKIILRYLHEKY